MSESVLPMFSSKSFIVSGLMFRSLIHFDFIFVYGVRIQEAWGWYTGMTQRDGMGREVGGGFRMGNTCTPMADAC